ncbi:MAG: class I SAM-dependent methyltransferase [Deltaproteobacteria bacterium]|nr:class I SAM-dependent methyltransferase [Deltaproteobacteria bacterium]
MSNVYDNNYLLNLSAKYIVPLIIKHLSFPENSGRLDLIDVGCGNGSVLQLLKNHYGSCFEYTGIDLYKNEIGGIKFHQVDLNGNFSNGFKKYDVVICCEVIEHVIDTDAFISGVKKLLNGNGILILTTPNLGSFLNRILLLFGFQPLHTEVSWKNPYLGREILYEIGKIGRSPAAGHLRLFTFRALRDFLSFHGFEIMAVDGFAPYEGIMKRVSGFFRLFPGLMPGMFFAARLTKVISQAVTPVISGGRR